MSSWQALVVAGMVLGVLALGAWIAAWAAPERRRISAALLTVSLVSFVAGITACVTAVIVLLVHGRYDARF